jgi:2-polyprenyl-3-methyl-5-hydroxy-6-metoxy-1,4-benzoquinol methylase
MSLSSRQGAGARAEHHAAEQHGYGIPYHWAMGAFYRSVNDLIGDRVSSVVHGRFVLEMGCGDGYMTAHLARDAERVLGFDVSERAIAFARLIVRDPHVEFAVGRAGEIERFARRLERVEVIASFEVIEHLATEERRAFLATSRELLAARSGTLVLSTPNGARRRGHPMNPHHSHEFEPEELRAELLGAGFRDPRISGVYLQPPWPQFTEHVADTVPFRSLFRALARAGEGRPDRCRTLLSTCRA